MGFVSGQSRVSGGAPAGGGGGGGTVSLITSTDSSVIITDSGGPTVDLSVTPASIGALALSGGTMTGDIDMDGNSTVNETLITASTGISATTAALGFAHVYEATAAPITITVSTADFVEGREFKFIVLTTSAASGTPVTVATEGGQLIDGVASVALTFDHDHREFIVRGGNLVSS